MQILFQTLETRRPLFSKPWKKSPRPFPSLGNFRWHGSRRVGDPAYTTRTIPGAPLVGRVSDSASAVCSVILLLIAVVMLCGCHTAKRKPAGPAPVTPPAAKLPPPLVRPAAFWPLAPGTSWTYAGTLVDVTNSVAVTNAIKLICTVQESQVQRGYQVVRLSNFPPALSPWHAESQKPYVLLRTPAGEWHAIEADRARHVLARLADAKDPLDDLLTFETQVLAEPLKDGLRWGDPAGMQRLDGFYCWVTGAPRTETRADITGVSKAWKLDVFPIVFQCVPDRLDVQFAPTIGFLATDYIRHGTPGEVHLRLVELQQPTEK